MSTPGTNGTNGTEIAMTVEKPAAIFLDRVTRSAAALLDSWVGEARAAEAKGRVATAFSAAAISAKDPKTFYACTPASVSQCVATAALTGIMPGNGPAALAYLIPRRPRRDDPYNLTYNLSHRGLAALARRAGVVMIPVPVSHADRLVIAWGEVQTLEQNPDEPPTSWEELRGIALVIKDAATGILIYRGWVAKKLIEERRAGSDGYRYAKKPGNEWAQKSDPWHAWPVEQAMKTAMHYAVARGWAVVDDTEAMRALSLDADTNGSNVIDAEVVEQPKSARKALGLDSLTVDAEPEEEREPLNLRDEEPAPAEQKQAEPEPKPARKPPAAKKPEPKPEAKPAPAEIHSAYEDGDDDVP